MMHNKWPNTFGKKSSSLSLLFRCNQLLKLRKCKYLNNCLILSNPSGLCSWFSIKEHLALKITFERVGERVSETKAFFYRFLNLTRCINISFANAYIKTAYNLQWHWSLSICIVAKRCLIISSFLTHTENVSSLFYRDTILIFIPLLFIYPSLFGASFAV